MSENTTNKVNDAAEEVKAGAEQAAGTSWDATKEKIEKLAGDIGEEAGKVWDKVEDKTEDVWDATKEKASELKDKVAHKIDEWQGDEPAAPDAKPTAPTEPLK